jgi:Protein of unknown function (DUF6044)
MSDANFTRGHARNEATSRREPRRFWDRVSELISGVGPVTWACAVVALVHLVPRLILGTRSIVTVHDNLDSDFLYQILITKPGRMFDNAGEIPELLNGVPRLAYPTGASLSAVLFALLPPFWAYVVLEQAVHVVGFLGMYWLLKDYLPGSLPRPFRLFLAATFACLPFYVIHMASISGQPAVAWALLQLREGRGGRSRVPAFGVLALFPFISVLPTAGAFVVAVGAVAAAVCCVLERRWHRAVWLGLALLVVLYAVSDWAFVHAMLAGSYASHRDTWNRSVTWSEYLSKSVALLVWGQNHAASVPAVCLIAMAVTATIAFVRRRRALAVPMLGFLAVCAVLSFVPELPLTPVAEPLRNRFRLFHVMNVRTYWCVAPICFFGFALAVETWWTNWRWRIGASVMAGIELLWILSGPRATHAELAPNYRELAAYLTGGQPRQMTYADYVAAPVFDSVRRAIAQPQESYRVLSVGINPARAALNGFYCADGYHNNYPLEYKARFRRLIEDNLKRDKWSRRRFDEWGSRAQTFIPRDRGEHYGPSRKRWTKPIKNVTLNLDALHDLNVRYVFASSKLKGASIDGALEYVRSFEVPDELLVVHLYQVR